MRTPEDADELGRDPCPLRPGIPFVVRCLSSLSLLGWSMILVEYLCQQAGRKELEYTLSSSEQKFISKSIRVGVQESHGNSWSSFGTRSSFLMHLDNVPKGRLCSWEFNKGRLLLVSYLGKRRNAWNKNHYFKISGEKGTTSRTFLASRNLIVKWKLYNFLNKFLIKSPKVMKKSKCCPPTVATCLIPGSVSGEAGWGLEQPV